MSWCMAAGLSPTNWEPPLRAAQGSSLPWVCQEHPVGTGHLGAERRQGEPLSSPWRKELMPTQASEMTAPLTLYPPPTLAPTSAVCLA